MSQNIYIQNGVLAISSKAKIKIDKSIFKSMRVQLLCVLIIIGIIPMLIFMKILVSTYISQAITQKTNELQYHGNIISNLLVSSGVLNSLNAETLAASEVNSEITQVADAYKGRIIVVDNNLYILKDTYGLEEGKTIISEEVIKGIRGNINTYVDDRNKYVEIVLPITHPNTKETLGVIIMSFSITSIYDVEKILNQKAMLLFVCIFIFVIVVAFFYSGILTKPLKMIVHSINKLTEGYMDETVSITGFTEIEHISEAFNKMIARMQKLEDTRQEFVSNVSHELKTPITSIKVLSESLLAQKEANIELYQEFFVDIANEIERENKIINDLLSLVKLDKKAGEINIASVDINELLEMILKRLRPIAAKRNIELVFESFRPVVAEVDEVKLSLAINNLIENAIKYNYDDGWVRVSLNADHKFFYIKVTDSGVGIPEDEQDNIFERFYRIDKARSRETGGTGLGLSITRNAILMHRGAIKVYSKEKEGTTFTVRVPLNYVV